MQRARSGVGLALLLVCLCLPSFTRAADPPTAMQACQNLVPVFVADPTSMTIAVEDRGEQVPLGVKVGWTSSKDGDGWIRCWFLPRIGTGDAWQFAQVESSRYGTLSRYDVQQAFKMLRLKQREARVVLSRVPDHPLVPWLYFLQQVLNGLALACVYALVAVAFTLTAAASRTIMFAFGELVTLGAWLFLIVHVGLQLGMGLTVPVTIGVGLIVSAGTAALFAFSADRLVFSRMRSQRGSIRLIASIGLAIMLQEAIRLAAGNRPRQMSVVADARIVVIDGYGFDVSVTSGHLWIAAATCLIAGALAWMLARSSFGRCLRAVVQDPSMASLCGVDIGRIIGRTFLLAGALGGAGGLVLIAEYGVADHATGLVITLKALTAALVGGIGSVPGAFIGGFIIAAVETASSGYASAAWKDVYVMAVLVALLIFRPEGLFATRRAQSADESIN